MMKWIKNSHEVLGNSISPDARNARRKRVALEITNTNEGDVMVLSSYHRRRYR